MRILSRFVTSFAFLLLAASRSIVLADEIGPPLRAPTPPRGWNSFDAWDCRIDEATFRSTVDVMAERLLPHGWEYAVIDYIWWHPEPGEWGNPQMRHGHPNLELDVSGKPVRRMAMDSHGRLLPSVERFPSAAAGKGFKPLADYVHAKGLKFGIHIMRGIHLQAILDRSPILGAAATAADIAEMDDTCGWCNHMRGVDPSHQASQAYYDSLFELYASWEVDFIKADDTMFPQYHAGEIEMIRKAIERCGRPMVLSLSCGEAPLSRATHLVEQADMWRISADFWDDWESLEHNFTLLEAWSPFIGRGGWPDADMLPIGRIALENRPKGEERWSRFTAAEQQTLMTLWCIARSPLMMGGDLLTLPDTTFDLITNAEVLAVNSASTDNRQVRRDENSCVWVATEPVTGDRYVALFNLADHEATVTFELDLEALGGLYKLRDLWNGQLLGPCKGRIKAKLPAHGSALYRLTPDKDTGVSGALDRPGLRFGGGTRLSFGGEQGVLLAGRVGLIHRADKPLNHLGRVGR